MTRRRFAIVDVFAEERYAGNQLAVVRDCAGLSGADMQAIAREMNYSETTFILAEEPESAGYPVRIFTPAAEVPFAGHPTLGTAFVIRQELMGGTTEPVTLALQAGSIPVSGRGDLLWMEQNPPEFGGIHDNGQVASLLGLHTPDIERNFPVQEVSTGLPFVICPLTSLAALQAIQVEKRAMLTYVENSRAKALLVFAPQGRSPVDDLAVRVFTDYYGIPEDPATGSANGCLAAYLARHRYFGSAQVDVRVGQGHEIGRPSTLYLQAEDADEGFRVRVGGRVIPVAEGVLL